MAQPLEPAQDEANRWDVRLSRSIMRAYESGWQRRRTFRYWQELERSQWLSAGELDALRVARLRALLAHAEANCPWYAQSWEEAGLGAAQLNRIEDLRRWPVLSRETIRANRLAMRCIRPQHELMSKSTGGSSGVPLHFDIDSDSYERRMAAAFRGYGWAGAGPGTKQWYLWGVAPSSTSAWKKRKVSLYDRIYRRTTKSCFELADDRVEEFARSLADTRPDVIVAYTNALYAFARMLDRHGITPYQPRSLVVGAEQLHEYQRVLIERVFGAPVFETYGSREFMLIGAECHQHQGLHITSEQLIVELLDDDNQPVPAGTEGNVVITDLTNFGMPFIRYANGDRAIADDTPCACGRSLPRLATVTGRVLDVITTASGRRLPGEFFPHIIKELSVVDRFQVIQHSPSAITIRVVAPSWSSQDEAWLRQEIGAAAGPDLEVGIEVVPEIALTAAGKLRVVINQNADTVMQGHQ